MRARFNFEENICVIVLWLSYGLSARDRQTVFRKNKWTRWASVCLFWGSWTQSRSLHARNYKHSGLDAISNQNLDNSGTDWYVKQYGASWYRLLIGYEQLTQSSADIWERYAKPTAVSWLSHAHAKREKGRSRVVVVRLEMLRVRIAREHPLSDLSSNINNKNVKL